MRLRNNPNAISYIESSSFFVKQLPLIVDQNFVIELGMGKGEMLTELAQQNRNINYVGIEKFATVAVKAAKKAEKEGLKNFWIICKDISELKALISGQVDKIWLTFSDPWPKKRHAKRRLTHINFLKLYRQVLSKNGVLHLKTDNDSFFEWTIQHFAENNLIPSLITRDLHNHPISVDNVVTGYEKKWASQGKSINYLEIKLNE